MQTIPFIRMAIRELDRSLIREVRDLEPEQMVYRPSPEANTINFLTWHLTRIQDNSIHSVIASQSVPTLWEREQWHQRFGLGPQDSGSGFNTEQVGAFQPEKETLLAYCERVFAAMETSLDALSDDDLDRVLNPEQPRMSVGRNIQSLVIGHGYWHLGEIHFLKGLQGMPFGR